MKKLLALAGIIAAFSVGINTNTAFAAPTDVYFINFTINSLSIDIPDVAANATWIVNAEEEVLAGLGVPPFPTPIGLLLQTSSDYLQGSARLDGGLADDSIHAFLISGSGAPAIDLLARVSAVAGPASLAGGANDNRLRVDCRNVADPLSRVVGSYQPAVRCARVPCTR